MRPPQATEAPVEPGSPKDPGGPGEPVQPPEPEVVPSSTPSGPQTIPVPGTPEGEPGPDIPPESQIEESNPNAAGPQGLRGGMGVSSERTGPFGGTEPESADAGVQGTGSRGTAAKGTEGTMSTSGQERAEGPEMDDTQQEATQDWRETQPEAGAEDDAETGESNTAEVPSHDFDPSRNTGHSHG